MTWLHGLLGNDLWKLTTTWASCCPRSSFPQILLPSTEPTITQPAVPWRYLIISIFWTSCTVYVHVLVTKLEYSFNNYKEYVEHVYKFSFRSFWYINVTLLENIYHLHTQCRFSVHLRSRPYCGPLICSCCWSSLHTKNLTME